MNLFLEGFAKEAINEGNGRLIPIIIPYDKYKTDGVGLMNPSVFNDDGIIRVIVRCVNYLFVCSDYSSPCWDGPIQYLHQEDDVVLRTQNYIVTFDDSVNNIVDIRHIDMMNLHEPIWEMIGLEDARLFRWNGKLYGCGCRRDTNTEGISRMELSELEYQDERCVEVSRTRMAMPNGDNEYAEKNWMPIVDKPFHWLRWINPSEVVTYDIGTNTTSLSIVSESEDYDKCYHRGGTHVVRYKDYYICFGHLVHLVKPYAGAKQSVYTTVVAIYDLDFNLIKITNEFTLTDTEIEFVCGLCLRNDKFILSFGYNDNAAYLLEFDAEWLLNKLLQ